MTWKCSGMHAGGECRSLWLSVTWSECLGRSVETRVWPCWYPRRQDGGFRGLYWVVFDGGNVRWVGDLAYGSFTVGEIRGSDRFVLVAKVGIEGFPESGSVE